MMDDGHAQRLIWSLIGSVAGAVTALSFQSWKRMTLTEIILTLFVATSFAFFVSPLIFRNLEDVRVAGGIFYLMATGSNVLIPRAVRWLSNTFGTDASEKGSEQ